MGLAREIERLRKRRGMTYQQLAEASGVKLSTLYGALGYCRDDVADKYIDQLCRALNVDAEALRRKYCPDAGETPPLDEEQPKQPEENEAEIDSHAALCRYDRILKAVRDGVSDKRIMAEWPELTGDVLMVYHKIADGRLCSRARNGGMYGKRDAALAEFCAIAFRTGSLHVMTDHYNSYDSLRRW